MLKSTEQGKAGWIAFNNFQKLLEMGQANDIPVIFTATNTTLSQLCGISPIKWRLTPGWKSKPIKLLSRCSLPTELVTHKSGASGFFKTPLAICLQAMGIDALLVAGMTTLGNLLAI